MKKKSRPLTLPAERIQLTDQGEARIQELVGCYDSDLFLAVENCINNYPSNVKAFDEFPKFNEARRQFEEIAETAETLVVALQGLHWSLRRSLNERMGRTAPRPKILKDGKLVEHPESYDASPELLEAPVVHPETCAETLERLAKETKELAGECGSGKAPGRPLLRRPTFARDWMVRELVELFHKFFCPDEQVLEDGFPYLKDGPLNPTYVDQCTEFVDVVLQWAGAPRLDKGHPERGAQYQGRLPRMVRDHLRELEPPKSSSD